MFPISDTGTGCFWNPTRRAQRRALRICFNRREWRKVFTALWNLAYLYRPWRAR